MIKSYKLQSVSCFQLFSLLFISRILVSLTYIPSLNAQQTKGDLLLSVLLMLPLLLLCFVPVYFYMKYYQNENLATVARQVSKPVGIGVSGLYCFWFLFIGALNLTRFVYFVTSEMNQNASPFFLVALITLAAGYGAYLGIQSLGRASVVVLWAMLISFIFVMLFALKHFNFTNFSPILENKLTDNIMNAVSITCNTSELTVILFLIPRMEEKIQKKNIAAWVAGIVALVFSLYFVSVGTLGDFAEAQSFPIYSMSQISGVGILQRLDSIHTSIWIVALFLKTALFLIAAQTALKGVFKNLKMPWTLLPCIILIIGLAYGMSFSFPNYWKTSNQWVNIVPFVIFGLVIPGIFALLAKRKKGGVPRAVTEEA